ncbi:MAG TPA: hypothetical protein VES95_07200 [Dermatophilaceae bacterium]|nr:hypothetical protein [Dermatophilaceae bacterium]
MPMAVRGEVSRPGQGWPTHLPGLLGPALAALVVTALAGGRPGLSDLWARCTRWRVGWAPWLAVGAVLVLLAVPLVVGPEVSRRDLVLVSGAPAVGLLTVP